MPTSRQTGSVDTLSKSIELQQEKSPPRARWSESADHLAGRMRIAAEVVIRFTAGVLYGFARDNSCGSCPPQPNL
jgi:hypothetical protein